MTGAQTGRLSSTDPNLQNILLKQKTEEKLDKHLFQKKVIN